jgi:uncharacterized protein (TIGR03435 family)
MGSHTKETRHDRKHFLATVGVATLVIAGVLSSPRLPAQAQSEQSPATSSPTIPGWQRKAGGKMAFDVASIKQNTSDERAHTNVNLSFLEDVPPKGGLLSAVGFSLNTYIGFAYNLSPGQVQLLRPGLPKWAISERFDVQARAEGSPTRDQMRLMMQSLLADRFKLAVHFETRQVPVFALVLDKPGKIGTQLIPHPDTAPCVNAPPQPAPSATPASGKDDRWFTPCGSEGMLFVSGRAHSGGENLTMDRFANMLPAASMGALSLDRPVSDQTGLSGNFDFRIEFTPEFAGPPPPNFQPDATGPTFIEALREQLGLKLVPQTGPVDVLVIDHVEEPSPN